MNSACRSRPCAQHAAQLRGQREPAGRGEALADLLHAELAQRPPVDLLGAGVQRQAQHHVGQVDRLPPGAGACLREGHVNQQHVTVADQQVARLDVAVRQPGVPQLANDPQAVVDDAVVDFGVAELYRAIEELGHQQVLPVWRELDKAVGAGAGQPGVPHDAQRVVLLFHQPPHGVERFLVLQLAVQ